MAKQTTHMNVEFIRELLEKDIHHIRSDCEEIKEHLRTLNGQVAKNTDFRKKHTWIVAIVSTVSAALGTGLGLWLQLKGVFGK